MSAVAHTELEQGLSAPAPASLLEHEYLTIKEAALLLRVHENTVRNSIRYGNFPHVRLSLGQAAHIRIPTRLFLEWQRKQLEGGQK